MTTTCVGLLVAGPDGTAPSNISAWRRRGIHDAKKLPPTKASSPSATNPGFLQLLASSNSRSRNSTHKVRDQGSGLVQRRSL